MVPVLSQGRPHSCHCFLLLPMPNPALATASFAIEDNDSLEQLLTALILDPRFNLK